MAVLLVMSALTVRRIPSLHIKPSLRKISVSQNRLRSLKKCEIASILSTCHGSRDFYFDLFSFFCPPFRCLLVLFAGASSAS